MFAFFASLQRRPHFRSFSHAVFCSGVGQSAATSPPIERPTPATAFPKPPTGFPVAGSVAQGPRTPIYYTYFIPSKNVSTLQPLSILRWESAQNWLKGLNFKPFSRVQRGGVERLFVACAPPGLGMDHPPCHSRLKGLKGLKNKPFSHFFYENKWRNDGG